MPQNIGITAATFFDCIGQDVQTVESSLLVDRLGQLDHSSSLPNECKRGRAGGFFRPLSGFGTSCICCARLKAASGWLNRRQQAAIEYLRTENQVLKEKLGKNRILLDDDQRRHASP